MQEKIRLTQFARHGGCAAKIGPDTLSRVLGRLPKFSDPDLIVGFETSDDAAVYKITDDVAVIALIAGMIFTKMPGLNQDRKMKIRETIPEDLRDLFDSLAGLT